MDEQFIEILNKLLVTIPVFLIILVSLAGIVGILGILKAIRIHRIRENAYQGAEGDFTELKEKIQKELKKH